MQARFEGSLMSSLAELRAIEEERIAQERAAVIAAAEAKRRAAEEAEAKRIADEAARVAAEREAAIAIERAREAAEREARMRVEATEATERARLVAALEQERLAGELELRRAEVAKKRPTWMVALTVTAVLATGGFAWFAIGRMNASEAAVASKAAADLTRDRALQDREKARLALESAQTELAGLGGKIDRALVDLDAARTAEEKRVAAANLKKLRDEQRAAEERRAAALRAQEKAVRVKRFEISEECKNNSLAKGCT
ncbi:MAG: hypothetical protein SFX73_22425 [Kofleriaceae bacterium]|nr:hypothetical protein [Kofleriaceae bacterium]